MNLCLLRYPPFSSVAPVVLALGLTLFSASAERQEVLVLVPAPVFQKADEGSFSLRATNRILADDALRTEAEYLKGQLESLTGWKLPAEANKSTAETTGAIILQLDINRSQLGREGYELAIDSDGVRILAAAPAGCFYGIQSYLQLLPSTSSGDAWPVAACTIRDKPRFPWRGFMLDEARHFKGETEVKKLLDEMAALKMNVFHWHLTDDQGWRIEIKKYPRLTEIGGKRVDTQVGGWASARRAGEPHQGYYTQDQIKRIVAYAGQRHINIVPEIGMPGHAAAAIAAYPELGTLKKEVPVMDNFDEAVDIYDPSSPRVYEILGVILDEVAALFPGPILHIGGDEVHFTHWKNRESIAEMMKREKLSSMADVQLYFTNRMAKMVEQRSKTPMGWNEIYGKNVHSTLRDGDDATTGQLDRKTIIQFWMGNPKLATDALRNGYRIVNSWNQYTYLNQAYARIPLEKAYSFDPVFPGLSAEEESRMLGVSCQMWGEWVPSGRELEYYIFPRIAAIAEVAWSPAEMRNFASFKQRLPSLLGRWKRLGIQVGLGQIEPPTLAGFEDAPVIGNWSSEVIGSGWKDLEWPIVTLGEGTRELHIGFRHIGGQHAIDIERVDLLVDGKIVASDLHPGSAGGQPKDVIYSLIAPPTQERRVAVRAKVRGAGGTDSKGEVTLKMPSL